jgi:hypothetical protein
MANLIEGFCENIFFIMAGLFLIGTAITATSQLNEKTIKTLVLATSSTIRMNSCFREDATNICTYFLSNGKTVHLDHKLANPYVNIKFDKITLVTKEYNNYIYGEYVSTNVVKPNVKVELFKIPRRLSLYEQYTLK